MKKKVGIIASSVATIAVCASMVAGSTYALFTSEDKVDIAITSGKVSVTADIGGTAYSAINLPAEIPDGYQVSYPTEGKAVATSNGVLNLENLIPGDKVELELKVVNTGTVSAQYQYKLECTDGEALMNQIKVTLGDSTDLTAEGGLKSYTSDWNTVEAGAEFTYSLTLSLPAQVGNAYQGLSTSIKTSVYAVQSNVATEENAESIENFPVVDSVSSLFNIAEEGGFAILSEDMSLKDTEIAEYTTEWTNSKGEYFGRIMEFSGNSEIDLNGHNLTLDKVNFGVKGENAVLSIRNGKINSVFAHGGSSVINVQDDATLYLDKVEILPKKGLSGTGYGIACHNSSNIVIKNSKIAAGVPVGTNASTAAAPNVVIDKSELEGFFCGLLFNVDGKLTVTNSSLKAINYGAIIRGGDATFTNCTLSNNSTNLSSIAAGDVKTFNDYYIGKWGEGTNYIPLNTLVVGNKNVSGGYGKNATCKLINTKLIDGFAGITSTDNDGNIFEHHTVYVYGIDEGVSAVTYDAATEALSSLNIEGSVRCDNGGTCNLK